MNNIIKLATYKEKAENWDRVAGYIKNLITEYDYLHDNPNDLISKINNTLDDAFSGKNISLNRRSGER